MDEANAPSATTDYPGIPIEHRGSVLRPLKASEVLARSLVRDIRTRQLNPGDSLESESDMLKKYGVSRESLREGLRLLEVQGMISIRRGPGGGPVVGTVDPANLGRMQALFFHLAGATYQELFDAWVLAESTLARLAAGNEDADLRTRVMAPYLDGDAHMDEHQDLEVYVQGHGGFHSAVASLADNKVLEVTFRSYGLIVGHHIATVGDPRSIRKALVDDHIRLASAIQAGNRDLAAGLMDEHLRQVIATSQEQLKDLVTGPIEWL
ncbi:FCD domain-containing protein [Nocardioides sp. AE5]|uniref:FadR/GntR family transcriptional regulator n=1 Tax=Nocardioides sp. AE5 TaxID=2962573 RepID=UPI002881D905|nr:FCD domain-containing protein [Nocardioides sp. AE5]MDT0202690.1 FCD domain-containing protein [Nocardioides sp. AE5]